MTMKEGQRLFYVLDIEAMCFGRDPKITVIGYEYAVRRAAAETDNRYEVYTSLREFNEAVRYYRSIF